MGNQRATVTSAWLHVHLPATGNMSAILSQSTTAFNSHPGMCSMTCPPFYAEEQEVFDGRLNDKGAVTFNPNISVRTSAPGFKASFRLGFSKKEGHSASIGSTLPYHPTNTTWVDYPNRKPRQCFIPIPPIRLTSLPLLPKGYPCPINRWEGIK